VRRAPATSAYLLILAATTLVLQLSSTRFANRLLLAQSTNLHHLARDPIRVLVTSAFWLTGAWQLPAWAALFVLVVAPVERRLGSRKTIVVFAIGHVGATLLAAGGLWVGLALDAVDRSVVHARDVGASYGFSAVAAVATVLAGPRLRVLCAACIAVYLGSSLVTSPSFTAFGHVFAVLLGLACVPLVARIQLDDELAVERFGDLQQGVDPGRPAAALEAGDRRLRRADELGELAL
jgi:hypothetical protein